MGAEALSFEGEECGVRFFQVWVGVKGVTISGVCVCVCDG